MTPRFMAKPITQEFLTRLILIHNTKARLQLADL
jgi:hypothetical protein